MSISVKNTEKYSVMKLTITHRIRNSNSRVQTVNLTIMMTQPDMRFEVCSMHVMKGEL